MIHKAIGSILKLPARFLSPPIATFAGAVETGASAIESMCQLMPDQEAKGAKLKRIGPGLMVGWGMQYSGLDTDWIIQIKVECVHLCSQQTLLRFIGQLLVVKCTVPLQIYIKMLLLVA